MKEPKREINSPKLANDLIRCTSNNHNFYAKAFEKTHATHPLKILIYIFNQQAVLH